MATDKKKIYFDYKGLNRFYLLKSEDQIKSLEFKSIQVKKAFPKKEIGLKVSVQVKNYRTPVAYYYANCKASSHLLNLNIGNPFNNKNDSDVSVSIRIANPIVRFICFFKSKKNFEVTLECELRD